MDKEAREERHKIIKEYFDNYRSAALAPSEVKAMVINFKNEYPDLVREKVHPDYSQNQIRKFIKGFFR